jgi:ABC-type oligopeptide transport system substrate-binding subunit
MGMKKSLLLTGITVLALIVAFSVFLAAAQNDASYSGTLVDSKRYLNHGQTANDHGTNKNCGTLCLKGGTPGGLLTSDKKFYALLAPSIALAPYVGQEIRVSGSLVNGSINVSKVEVNQNGSWQEVKLSPTA